MGGAKPKICDNIGKELHEGLVIALENVHKDSCVGYFRLRAGDVLADCVDACSGADDNRCCPILVGRQRTPDPDECAIVPNHMHSIMVVVDSVPADLCVCPRGTNGPCFRPYDTRPRRGDAPGTHAGGPLPERFGDFAPGGRPVIIGASKSGSPTCVDEQHVTIGRVNATRVLCSANRRSGNNGRPRRTDVINQARNAQIGALAVLANDGQTMGCMVGAGCAAHGQGQA